MVGEGKQEESVQGNGKGRETLGDWARRCEMYEWY
jgi:hypothetical protein